MSRSQRKRILAQQGVHGALVHALLLQTSPLERVTSYKALGVEVPPIVIAPSLVDKPQGIVGLPLLQALQASTFLYRAARRYTETAFLVTDGVRFWTSDLNFNGMYTEELTLPIQQDQPIWRPIFGNESGWHLA